MNRFRYQLPWPSIRDVFAQITLSHRFAPSSCERILKDSMTWVFWAVLSSLMNLPLALAPDPSLLRQSRRRPTERESTSNRALPQRGSPHHWFSMM